MNVAKWIGTAISTVVVTAFLVVLPSIASDSVAGPGGCCPKAATVALDH